MSLFPVQHYILYTLPRSGSTPVIRILAEALYKAESTLFLDEYFNPDFTINSLPTAFSTDVAQTFQVKIGTTSLKQNEIIFKARLQMLFESKQKYLIKILPDQVFDPGVRNFILSNNRTMFLSRRNHFLHFISYALSLQTHRYYENNGSPHWTEKITIKRTVFRKFCREISELEALKKIHPKTPNLYLEDLLKGTEIKIHGNKIQFNQELADLHTIKTDNGELQRYVENLKEVQSWYRKSPLNKSFPLDP